MADITPPDLASGVGRVRKYIPDMVQLEDPKNPAAAPSYYFSDAEVAAFLAEYSDKPERWHVKRAAADAIDALANNEALILKKIKTEDLETDGKAVADALRAGARALRDRARQEEVEETPFVAVIPFRHLHPPTKLPWRAYR